jgi:hypothetical protein
MTQDKKTDKGKNNSLAHVIDEKENKDAATYDPDRYTTNGNDSQEGVPLEDQDLAKGYSTDARQGKDSASLHLADEDMDRRPEDPVAKAQDLKESYQKSKQNSDQEKSQETGNDKKENENE